nr:hypothetical protein [Bacteroides acidifaciens]
MKLWFPTLKLKLSPVDTSVCSWALYLYAGIVFAGVVIGDR